MDDLLSDLIAEMTNAGVQFLPWEPIAGHLDERAVGVAYSASPNGPPAQVALKPLGDRNFELVVLRDIQKRMLAASAGDIEAFQSFDPINNRKVAIIYDLSLLQTE